MKIFENKDSPIYRNKNACGYCRRIGHNRANCPHAPEDWLRFSTYQIPMNTTGTQCAWYKQPRYWGTWYEECKKTVILQQRNASKAKAKRTTARNCGFCGGAGHTRRNCSEMKKFVAQCYKANENWRRAAYEILVQEHGIDIGAAVEVQEDGSYWNEKSSTHVGLITSINWDSLNVMTAFQGCYDWGEKYGQKVAVGVMVDGTDTKLSLKHMCEGASLRAIISPRNSYPRHSSHWDTKLIKVIGRSERPLKEEWTTSYKEAFDYLCKKTNLQQLKERGVYNHIQNWANRT